MVIKDMRHLHAIGQNGKVDKVKDLRDFVLRIKELSEESHCYNGRDYNMPDSWFILQDKMIGLAEWNEAKKKNKLQDYETLMHIFLLMDLFNDELPQETILNLLAIFINIFQMAYIDNDGYIPDIFTDKSIDKE